MDGVTNHGLQFAAPAQSMRRTTYYGENSGVGRAIGLLPANRSRRLGFVGLGAGTLAAFGRLGDKVRFYEINPAVVSLATSVFSYATRTAAKVEIVLGDARLSMERELAAGEAQHFDLLALDAFSSEAIPVHLLTREAFEIYLKQLAPNGVIAVHISNRYLNLRPVVEGLAHEFGLGVVTILDDPKNWWLYRSTWVLVSSNQGLLANPRLIDAADIAAATDQHKVIWTDDHASIFKILK